MELLQLKYFQTVAQLEHITKAAEELSVSQPSLSKTIQTLEKQLGVALFDRKGKYIKLNESGKLFLAKVDIALSALEDGKQQLQILKNEESEQISLAFLAASPLLPELLSQFREKNPRVKFHLLQHISGSPKYNYDLCISSLPLQAEGIKSIPLLTEEIFLAVPLGHRLACRKNVQLKEAENESFIHLKQGNALREITDDFCRRSGFSPHSVFESDDPATVRGLIRAGQGVSFIPAISWGIAPVSSVKLIHIEDPACFRTIGLSWIENRFFSDIILKFRDFTINFFKSFTA